MDTRNIISQILKQPHHHLKHISISSSILRTKHDKLSVPEKAEIFVVGGSMILVSNFEMRPAIIGFYLRQDKLDFLLPPANYFRIVSLKRGVLKKEDLIMSIEHQHMNLYKNPRITFENFFGQLSAGELLASIQ
jgi:hypothetical protein